MPITHQQDIPNKVKEKEAWTIKRLFPIANVVSAALKKFSILQLFGGFALMVAGIGELIGRRFSVFWYIILLVLIGGIFFFDFKNSQKNYE